MKNITLIAIISLFCMNCFLVLIFITVSIENDKEINRNLERIIRNTDKISYNKEQINDNEKAIAIFYSLIKKEENDN